MQKQRRFFNCLGQSLLEYVVLLAVMAVVVLGAIWAVGHHSGSRFADAKTLLHQQEAKSPTAPGSLPGAGGSSSVLPGVPTSTMDIGGSTTAHEEPPKK